MAAFHHFTHMFRYLSGELPLPISNSHIQSAMVKAIVQIALSSLKNDPINLAPDM